MNLLKVARYKIKQSIVSRSNILANDRTSPDHDILFVWIPKAAGSSVYNAMHDCFGMDKLKKNPEARWFRNKGAVTFGHICVNSLLSVGYISEEYYDSAYKFSFVRNPYDRSVSLFNYLKQIRKLSEQMKFTEFLELIHQKRPNIGLYNVLGLSQSNPQTDWLIGGDGKFLVDEIFDIGQFSEFAAGCHRRFGVIPKARRDNISKRYVTTNQVLDDKYAIYLIEKIYRRDFDLLGYERLSEKESSEEFG